MQRSETMQQTKHSFDITDIIEIIVLFIGIWSLSPVIKNSINQMYPVLLAIACFIMILFEYGNRLRTNVALISLYLVLMIMYKILGVSDDTWAVHSNIFMFFFTMLVSIYMLDRFSKKKKRRDGIILLSVFILNLFYQYYLYFTLGIESLYHAKNLLEEGIVVGSTAFVTDAMFIGMLSVILFSLSNNLKKKTACVLLLVLIVYYIYEIQTRATALIFIFFFITICFALGFSKTITGGRIVLFIAICVLVGIVVPYAINLLANSENEYYARKFSAITDYLSNTQDVSSMDNQSFQARIYIASVSLNTWGSSIFIFLFGKGHDAGFYDVTGIGRHSEMIDLLPRYGILGASIVFAAFAKYYTTILGYLKNKRHYSYFFGTLVIYSIFNGIFLIDVGYVVNIIIPLVLIQVEENDEKDQLLTDNPQTLSQT